MSRRSKKINEILGADTNAYKRNFTISMDFAIVRGASSRPNWSRPAQNKLKKAVFIHYEFMAPQGDRDSRADIVAHYNGAKMFLDTESRPAKFWTDENGQEWTGWHHTFPIGVNDDLLDEMYDRPIFLRIWDTRDKVSTRARFDRPRVTVEDTLKEKEKSKETPSSATSRKSTAGISRPSATGRKSGPRKSGGSAAPKSARTSRKQSDAYGDIDSVYDDYEDPHQEHNDAVLDEIVSTDKFCTAEDGQGTMIQLWLHKFFVQNTTSIGSVYECCGDATALSNVSRIRVRMSLDEPLLVPRQIARLNPLEITILSTTRMPSTPLKHEELEKKCHKPYIKVGFPGREEHKLVTISSSRGSTLKFNQSLIVLTGRYSIEELEGFFRGAGLPMELHDRDRLPHDQTLDVIYSGVDEEFADFNAAVGVTLSAADVAPKAPTQSYDPYGVATVPLTDLLAGARVVSLECQVLPCARRDPPAMGSDGQPAELPVHPGHYVEFGTAITVRVEVTNALRRSPTSTEVTRPTCGKSDGSDLAIGVSHAVIVGESRVIYNLVSEFRDVVESPESQELCVLYIAPRGGRHIVILEGLQNEVQLCWKRAVSNTELDSVPVFNSGLFVLEPLYRELGLGVHTFGIEDTVGGLLRDPHVYVRDARGWDCLEGLSQLHELEAPGAIMSEIYEEGRLPTVHSLLNINRTFGIEPAAIHISPSPMTERPSLVEAELMQTPGDGTLLTIEEEESLARREGGKTKTFTAPPKSWRRQRKPINFVKRNVEAVATPALEHDCEDATVISPPPGEVYPYASQRLNTRERHRRAVVPRIPDGTTQFTDGTQLLRSDVYSVADDGVSPSTWSSSLRDGGKAAVTRHGRFDNTPSKTVDLSRDHDFLDGTPVEAPNLFGEVIPRARSPQRWDEREAEFDGLAASHRRDYEATMLPISLECPAPTVPFKYTAPLPSIGSSS